MKRIIAMLLTSLIAFSGLGAVRLKSLAHLSGLQENPITGYGLVIGLSGSGDSRRNKDTTQAIANVLQSFGVNISPNDINSRNSATVMVTANLPSFAHQGDKIDINVASLGDARSLLGGTLLITPLKGTDNLVYALAQGPISIGGFKYDAFGNVIQKNHPTSGLIPNGAVVEKTLHNELIDKEGILHLVLNRADFTTASHIETALNQKFGPKTAHAISAQDVDIQMPHSAHGHLIHFVSLIENMNLTPDNMPTVVVNEKTGIVVAGNEVMIDPVTISHGQLQLSIATEFNAAQPTNLINPNRNIKTAILPSSSMTVKEPYASSINLPKGANVAELIKALSKVHTSTRDIIAILESLQRAGALHAELIIQ